MTPKKLNKDPNSQLLEKPTKSRPPLARLAKDDITVILYAKELKGESKKVSKWYKIGTSNNTKIEKVEIFPELTPQEIITPEKPKPNPNKIKRKRKTTEIENIMCRVMRKIFTVWLCKEDKVYVIKFAIGSLLTNLSYQVLFLNFELYMNDPENKDPIKMSDEISKYFNRISDPDQIHILIKSGN
ncbi:3326_t:CDS:2 [Diversispora eburnea]|uniref:3326_t:CDS:1 n=1 Tax=Diversispora eburnea TaxID=1213867 RepID=A0A9N9GS00_9GLOM|nr:3326_t:CDS:2 [Diversispora eburnea]